LLTGHLPSRSDLRSKRAEPAGRGAEIAAAGHPLQKSEKIREGAPWRRDRGAGSQMDAQKRVYL